MNPSLPIPDTLVSGPYKPEDIDRFQNEPRFPDADSPHVVTLKVREVFRIQKEPGFADRVKPVAKHAEQHGYMHLELLETTRDEFMQFFGIQEGSEGTEPATVENESSAAL